MSFHFPGSGACEGDPCRYGASKLPCRGPARAPDGPYLACLGGAETYGRFIARPFAALLEESLGRACVNLGSFEGGLDALARDTDLQRIAARADLCVLQVLPAQNLSNRFYRVHPRRNDRFLAPNEPLRRLYPELDFTRYNFCRHLLADLQEASPGRFAQVAAELKSVWETRVRTLLDGLSGRTVLLWLRFDTGGPRDGRIGVHSALVDEAMIGRLRHRVLRVIEVPVRAAGESGEMNAMLCPATEMPAAAHMIGQGTHYEIAKVLRRKLPGEGETKRPA